MISSMAVYCLSIVVVLYSPVILGLLLAPLSVGAINRRLPPPTTPSQSLPCKIWNYTMLDCSARNLSSVPPELFPIATGVDLSANVISELTVQDFTNLPRLRNLNLSLNDLQTIGNNTFHNLVSLQTLDLSQNSIEALESSAFTGLFKLEYLDLSKNSIISIPAEAFQDLENLRQLFLFYNSMSVLPSDALVHLRMVHTLDLSLNLLDRKGRFRLGEGFKSMRSLERLHLSGMNIDYLPNDSFSALQSLPITYLDLSLNSIYVIGNATFYPLTNLRQLSLKNTAYSAIDKLPCDIVQLDLSSSAVVTSKTLSVQTVHRLSLYLPNITVISFAKLNIREIQELALGSMSTLQELDLSHNLLRSLRMGVFEGLNSLQELDLSLNFFQNVPTAALSAFNNTHSLRILNLAGSQLRWLNRDDFTHVPLLTTLNLEGNQLTNLEEGLRVLVNIERLYIGNNNFYRIPPSGWSSALLALRILDISRNEGGEYGMYGTNSLDCLAPNLKELYVNNIEADFELAILLNCTYLVTLDVSQNELQDVAFDSSFRYGWTALDLPLLETLNLGGNSLTFLSASVFDNSPRLRSVNLSHNSLATVSESTFSKLNRLEALDLSYNFLSNISALDPRLPRLKRVTFSRNKITFVDVKLLAASHQPDLRVVDLSDNAYSCTCEVEDFRDWLLEETRLLLPSPSMYRCSFPADLQGEPIALLTLDFCVSYLAVYLGAGLSSGFIAIVAIVAVCVRYHWHMRYKFFMVFRRRLIRREEQDEPTEQCNNNLPRFDAFVSYNDHDREWVMEKLIPNLEDLRKGEEGFHLCVTDRDLPPGDSKMDIIVEAIQNSRRTILVLTDHFMDSEWCYYEMQMAHLRLFNEGRDVLVLILLGEIPDHKMTMLLRQTLCRKSYLKWPKDELGQQLFWDRLREELKTSSNVNHRLDV